MMRMVGRVAATDGPANPNTDTKVEGGDVTALPATLAGAWEDGWASGWADAKLNKDKVNPVVSTNPYIEDE